MEEYISQEEANEYLAYPNPQDVLGNLESGVRQILVIGFQEKDTVLIYGGMMGFDKGLSAFFNRWGRRQEHVFLLSQVTAQFRRYTDERMTMPFICTPHLLAKEMVVSGMDIPVTDEM